MSNVKKEYSEHPCPKCGRESFTCRPEEQCNRCDSFDEECRNAWIQFVCANIGNPEYCDSCYSNADIDLKQFVARFGPKKVT